jgi:hypothetical protein
MGFTVRRATRVDPPATGQLRAGSARVDLTPALGKGLAGYGPTSNAAQGTFGRLTATLLLLEDPHGVRALLVAADLFCGSRYVHEALGRLLAVHGVSTDRILVAGNHTHRAPSSLLGERSFDRLAGPAWVRSQWDAHFDQSLADALVERIATAVEEILGSDARTPDRVTLRPCELALTAPRVWDVSTNRSSAALDGSQTDQDPEAWLWGDPPALTDADRLALAERFSGSPAPTWIRGPRPATAPPFLRGDLTPTPSRPVTIGVPSGPPSVPAPDSLDAVLRALLRRGDLGPALKMATAHRGPPRDAEPTPLDPAVVDARIHLLLAREPGGPAIGGFGLFSATPAMFGAAHAIYTGDAVGVAGAIARSRLEDPVPIGLGGGAVGDSNLVPPGRSFDDLLRERDDLGEAAQLVQATAEVFAAAIVDAMERAPVAWTSELTLHPTYVDLDPVAAGLDPHARQSGTSLAGSELAGSPLSVVFREGMRSPPEEPPTLQSPKPGIPQLEGPASVWPLRALELRGPTGPWWTLLGIPAEVSVALANELSVVVGQGRHPVSVASPCGGFSGYANTRWGYLGQAYEGSMNLRGRFTGDVLLRAFADGLSTGPLDGEASFGSTPGTLPGRLGRHARKPNALSRSVTLQAKRFKSLGRLGRPRLEVERVGSGLLVRAVVDGAVPVDPVWSGPLVAVGATDARGTRVVPFTFGKLPADDVHWPFLVWADVRRDRCIWRFQVEIPAVDGAIGLVLEPPVTGAGVRYLVETGWV